MAGIVGIVVLLLVIVIGRILIRKYRNVELSWLALFIAAGVIILCVIYAKNHGNN